MDDKDLYRRMGYREDFDPNNRRIKDEYVLHNDKKYYISTIDLGLDHNFFDDGDPLWYETMIFEVVNDKVNYSGIYQDRYSTREEAIEGHIKAKVKLLNDELT